MPTGRGRPAGKNEANSAANPIRSSAGRPATPARSSFRRPIRSLRATGSTARTPQPRPDGFVCRSLSDAVVDPAERESCPMTQLAHSSRSLAWDEWVLFSK